MPKISFKKYAKQLVDIKVEMSSRRSRGLVMFTCYLQTGRWSRPATVCGFSLCSLQICLHSRDRTLCNFCTPTPHRERDSFRSHTFSLFLALIDSREPAFTRPPTARYCKLLTALLLGLLLTLSYPIISYTRHATPFHRLWHHKITT